MTCPNCPKNMPPKKPEMILAFDKSLLSKWGLSETNAIMRGDFSGDLHHHDVASALVIRQREHLDNSKPCGREYAGDRDYVQLLPYTVLRTADGKVFTYSRKKTSGEQRLVGDRSCGYSGHIDFNDIITDDSNNVVILSATVRNSMGRELDEEVVFQLPEGMNPVALRNIEYQAKAVGLIYDTSNEVGFLHLGMVYVIDLPEGVTVSPAGDDHAEHGKLVDVTDLDTDAHENWTRLVAQNFLA